MSRMAWVRGWLQGWLLGAAFLLAGCGQGVGESIRMGAGLLVVPEVLMGWHGAEVLKSGTGIGREELVYVPEKAEVVGNELRFGQLVVHLPEEVWEENRYGIGGLKEEKAFGWRTTGEGEKEVSFGQSVCRSYIDIKPEAGVRLLGLNEGRSMSEDYELRIYQEGSYESPVQNLSGSMIIQSSDLKDLNFDGYVDLRLTAELAYLWNHEHQCYEKAVYPQEEISFDFFNLHLLGEQKIIYTCDTHFDFEEDAESDYEGLWKWEGNELLLKRACVRECSEDTVSIQVWEGTEDKKVLPDKRIPMEEWDENPDVRRYSYE